MKITLQYVVITNTSCKFPLVLDKFVVNEHRHLSSEVQDYYTYTITRVEMNAKGAYDMMLANE